MSGPNILKSPFQAQIVRRLIKGASKASLGDLFFFLVNKLNMY